LVPRPPKNVLFTKAEVGRRIRGIRESRGITQVEMARALGIAQSNVSAMERGTRGMTVHQVVKLARVLKVSVDEILVGSNGSPAVRPATSLKLLRRLQRIEKLPEARQRVVLKFIDALIDQEADGSAKRRADGE
jgi:transcriptional regulator with XRE-family HTH domain